MTTDLSFPIGRYHWPTTLTPDERGDAIRRLGALPGVFGAALVGLSAEQLDTPYRPGGWTVRQTVHHTADSHMNAYIRLKLGLTETEPTIKPYEQDEWAMLPDTAALPIDVPLALLDGVHRKMAHLYAGMTDDQFARTIRHPENGVMTLDTLLGLYAWHGDHHAAHILGLRQRMGW
jgi:uncharacterized damage-inducible protein DinB